MIAASMLVLLGVYLTCGLAFAIPFALVGVKKVDPAATRSSWGFRLLIVPGTVAFWPLLWRRWARCPMAGSSAGPHLTKETEVQA